MSGRRVRVVVVEDSSVQRANLVEMLQADGDIVVVGEAETATEALDVIARRRPDVVTVDMIIPDGGGQFLIEQIMAHSPTPILVISATVKDGGSPTATHAVAGGALAAMAKPAKWTPVEAARLRRTVRALNGAVVIRHPRGRLRAPSRNGPLPPNGQAVVAVAASTGGPAALATILAGLSGLNVPVLVVQHLHADFIDNFMTWMQRVSALPVSVAEHHQRLSPGHVYIGPAGKHLRLAPGGLIELSSTPETTHRPSADELFASVAEHAGAGGIGVILTGIGDDGAQGLLQLARAGGRTIGQDEASSVVWGMPRAAGGVGAVQQFLDPPGIARALARLVQELRA